MFHILGVLYVTILFHHTLYENNRGRINNKVPFKTSLNDVNDCETYLKVLSLQINKEKGVELVHE